MAILPGVLRNAQCLLGIRGKPMTWLRIAIAAFVLMGLSGCAGFDGQQKRVISVKQANAMIASYRPDAAIELIGKIDPLDTAGRNTYRNRLVAAYLTAMDAHYSVFVRDISRSGKGMHLTFDTLTLGLTGAGAIFNKAASGLAAGATAAAGLRGSFDRELFADKTLPILISLMDSRRLEVRADILQGLSKPESVYTLEAVFSDLMRYESAGSIDGALSDAAVAAGERAKESQYDYSQAKNLCTVDAATDSARRGLMIELEQFEKDAGTAGDGAIAAQKRQSIQTAAKALGIDTPNAPTSKESSLAMLAPIRDRVEAQCNSAGVAALRAKIKAAGVPLT